MDQASNVRETAAFARRVVCRTLTVIGDAAAGTAIAWYLSTSAASADPDAGFSALDDQHPVMAEVVLPVSDAVDTVAAHLSDPPPAPENPLEDFGEKIKKAADRFGDHTDERVDVLPACADELCGDDIDAIVGIDDVTGTTADLGRMDVQTAAPPATSPATTAGAVTGPGVDPERTAERTATGRAYSDGMPPRGSPAPELPALPTWPAPFSPVPPSAPAPGHNGQAGSNPADSLLFAALPWLDHRTPGLVRGLTVPTTEATAVGRVGAQPGVAPD